MVSTAVLWMCIRAKYQHGVLTLVDCVDIRYARSISTVILGCQPVLIFVDAQPWWEIVSKGLLGMICSQE